MQTKFNIAIIDQNGQKQIDFANYSQSFVEVVFTIDNKEVKYGDYFSSATKGYCYPPGHHKPIRLMVNGDQLSFVSRGTIKAHVYAGTGELIEENYDIPPFIRFKLNERRFKESQENIGNLLSRSTNKRARFRRTSNNPIEVLEIPY